MEGEQTVGHVSHQLPGCQEQFYMFRLNIIKKNY